MEPIPSPPPAAATAPRRVPHLVLRPGLCVVRRDDRHLQVGLDAPHRLVVEDHPDVRRLLAHLAAGTAASTEVVGATTAGRRVVERLLEQEMLVDADLLGLALDRVSAPGGLERSTVLACFARHGDDAARRLAARADAVVVLDAPVEPAAAAGELLRAAGIGTVLTPAAGRPAAGATAALVVAAGEPDRTRLDAAVRAGLPHLLVSAGARVVTTGPFVVPGVTACVRCVDAHRGERDPRRATVLEQCVRDGAESGDPVLLAAGLAGAVDEVVRFVDGDRPVTWSATATLDGLRTVVSPWSRHPHCGCAWDALPATG